MNNYNINMLYIFHDYICFIYSSKLNLLTMNKPLFLLLFNIYLLVNYCITNSCIHFLL